MFVKDMKSCQRYFEKNLEDEHEYQGNHIR